MGTLGRLVVGSALYGAAIGLADLPVRALHNLVKLPLLLRVTAGVCAAAYAISARMLVGVIGGRTMLQFALSVFADLGVLLGALSPAIAWIAITGRPAESLHDLGDYGFFLGLNMGFIATCGALALARRARSLAVQHGLGTPVMLRLVAAWMAITFVVGAQWAFYLRPFFGAARVDDPGVFISGNRPDFRGARNFYEVVWHIVSPPEASR
jgi:hypothetical protein